MGISPDSDLGGEVFERELLLRLPEYGAEIGLILPSESKVSEKMRYDYIYRLPLKRRLRWFISNPLFLKPIKKAYYEKSIEILRIHSLRFTGPAVLLAKKLYNIDVPVIAHHHHIDPEIINWIVDSRVAATMNRIITGSEFSKKQLINEWGLKEENIEVIYYGVSEYYCSREKDVRLENKYQTRGKKVLLYLGALKKRKNLFFLLECLKGLSVIYGKEWICLISGRGKDFEVLKKQTKLLGLSDKVRFCGYIPENEKITMLNLCDIFLFPSLLEGFGMAAVEAMACGKPVIALNNASLPEIIKSGETGFLVSQGDKKEYIARIFYLIKNDKERSEMGRRAASYVKKTFNWDKCAEKVMSSYRDFADSYKKTRRKKIEYSVYK